MTFGWTIESWVNEQVANSLFLLKGAINLPTYMPQSVFCLSSLRCVYRIISWVMNAFWCPCVQLFPSIPQPSNMNVSITGGLKMYEGMVFQMYIFIWCSFKTTGSISRNRVHYFTDVLGFLYPLIWSLFIFKTLAKSTLICTGNEYHLL